MENVNPLTYLNNSSIIGYESVKNSQRNELTDANAEREFLKLLVEKIFVRDLNRTSIVLDESDGDSDLTALSNDFSNMIVNELFRQQIAEQLVDEKLIDLDLNTGENN